MLTVNLLPPGSLWVPAVKHRARVSGAVGTVAQGQVPLLSLSIFHRIIKHCRFNFGAGRVALAAVVDPMACSSATAQPLPGRVAQLMAVDFPSFLQCHHAGTVGRGMGNALA